MQTSGSVTALLLFASLFSIDAALADVPVDVPAAVARCSSCHDPTGPSTDPMIPTLAGIGSFYLENQFAVFEARARPCIVEVLADPVDKCALIGSLDKAQRREVAAYYAAFEYRPVEQVYDSMLAEAGAALHAERCARCHTEDGRQPLDDSGLLAGQPIAYLRRQLESFIDGSRWQPKSMAPETEDLDADDIEALAHFYAQAGSGFDND